MSKKIFQNLINQIKDTLDAELGILDNTGLIVACSDERKINKIDENVFSVISDNSKTVEINKTTYQKIHTKGKIEYVSFIASNDSNSLKYLFLFSASAEKLIELSNEKFDKDIFLKNIIEEKITFEEISFKAKEMHINFNVRRAVFFIKSDKKDENALLDVLQNLFPDKTKDFILTMETESIIFIKEYKQSKTINDVEQTAKTIADTLMAESMTKTVVGVGRICDNLAEIATSYKEAKNATEVGNIFGNDKTVISYEKLGIGRLIYQLPEPLCEMFLKEIFSDCSKNFFDNEMISTIQNFFENDLNVSETARKMYIHRNTLVYRIEKIRKETGLDIRKFDDAITLKFAMMVKKYLEKKI